MVDGIVACGGAPFGLDQTVTSRRAFSPLTCLSMQRQDGFEQPPQQITVAEMAHAGPSRMSNSLTGLTIEPRPKWPAQLLDAPSRSNPFAMTESANASPRDRRFFDKSTKADMRCIGRCPDAAVKVQPRLTITTSRYSLRITTVPSSAALSFATSARMSASSDCWAPESTAANAFKTGP